MGEWSIKKVRKKLPKRYSRKIALRKELTNFLSELLERSPADVLIPVQRKGALILKSLEKQVKLENIRILDSDYVTTSDIKGKRVLIVDDSVLTGITLKNLAENIRARGPKSLATAAFVVDKNSPVKPNFAYQTVDSTTFSKIAEMLNRFVFSLGMPLDTDNLILEGRFSSPISIKCFEKALKETGKAYELPPRDDVNTYGVIPALVRLNDAGRSQICELDVLPFVKNLEDIKIRLFLKKRQEIIVVFKVYPEVEIRDSKECTEFFKETCFLKSLTSKDELEKEIVCLDCIRFSLSAKLEKWFITNLQRLVQRHCNVQLSISLATWSGLETRYEGFHDRLQKIFVKGEAT